MRRELALCALGIGLFALQGCPPVKDDPGHSMGGGGGAGNAWGGLSGTAGGGGSTSGGNAARGGMTSTNGGDASLGGTDNDVGGTDNGGSENDGGVRGSEKGGATNSNGGSANGGSANGGSANGGSANGGAANGGAANGGAANGGAGGKPWQPSACPTTYDWPDNGVDEDNDGSDRKLTDANAVFVAPPAQGGSDSGDGTRAHPVATLSAAVTLAGASGKAIAVAQGIYAQADLRGLYVHGGYEASGWSRNPTVNVTRVDATAPLLIGGIPDSSTAGSLPGPRDGALEGFTVTGSITTVLVTDAATSASGSSHSSLRDSILQCDTCSTVVDLGISAEVSNNRIQGAQNGINVHPIGGITRPPTQVEICGNRVVGSSPYTVGIHVGDSTRGPVSVESNSLSLSDATAIGIRIERAGASATQFVTRLEKNLVEGNSATGISLDFGGRVSANVLSNCVDLSAGSGVGLAVTGAEMPSSAATLTIAQNQVLAKDAALSLSQLTQTTAVLSQNVLHGGPALLTDSGGLSWALTATQNAFDSTSTVAANVGMHFPAGLSFTSNNLIASQCVLMLGTLTPTCVATAANLNACSWPGCVAASGNVSDASAIPAGVCSTLR